VVYIANSCCNDHFSTDSPESAAKEIGLFFPDFDIGHWNKVEYEKFRTGLCKFDEIDFVHKTT